tara:strand:+ start:1176 stop:2642 length:1467 start_codon:yes stop_codon:yes gene_type:complete
MAAFKLGANDITAAYLGTQGICIINDGADTVFDAACGAQFTVTHTVSNSIGGTTNGYTISTSPGTTFTGATGDAYSFTTTVSLNSGYRWQGGTTPTISPSQPITGTVGSANSTVTTTISGATVELIPVGTVTATLNLDTSAVLGPAAGWNVIGDQNGTVETGNSTSVTYAFVSEATLNTGYEWVSGAPANASSPASGSTTIYSSATIYTAFGSAEVRLITYTVQQNLTNDVQGPSAGYNLNWNGNSNYTSPTGTAVRSGNYGVGYTFPATTLATNTGYTATQALTLSGEGAISGTFGTGATTYQVTAGGTVALTPTDVTVTLSYDTSGFTGAANATFSTAGGLTRTGAPGASYSFSTTITADSTYSFSGTSPQVLNGTFPSTSQGVTQYLTGTVSRPTLYYVDRSASPGGCGTFQGSSYWWPDPSGYLSGSSEAYDVAPSGTQVYADANYSSYYSTGGTYSITEPNTGADLTQYISSTGTVGTDNSCP